LALALEYEVGFCLIFVELDLLRVYYARHHSIEYAHNPCQVLARVVVNGDRSKCWLRKGPDIDQFYTVFF